jgi:cell division protein ZapA
MAQLTIDVNGRPYLVGCEDGQEEHLRELARVFDGHVRRLTGEVGQLGETRLLLMGALMMADELADARTRLAHLQAESTRLRTELGTLERNATAALDAAAKRLEALADQGVASGGTLI